MNITKKIVEPVIKSIRGKDTLHSFKFDDITDTTQKTPFIQSLANSRFKYFEILKRDNLDKLLYLFTTEDVMSGDLPFDVLYCVEDDTVVFRHANQLPFYYLDFNNFDKKYWAEVFHRVQSKKILFYYEYYQWRCSKSSWLDKSYKPAEIVKEIKKYRYDKRKELREKPYSELYSPKIADFINKTFDDIQKDFNNDGEYCLDNFRVADTKKPTQLKKYKKQRADGCCGFYDRVFIYKENGKQRKFIFGLNYGH